MRFTVTWNRSALDDLAAIWVATPDRRAVTLIVDELESRIAEVPHRQGQEFFGDRLIAQFPIAMVYSVSEDDRLIDGLQVLHK